MTFPRGIFNFVVLTMENTEYDHIAILIKHYYMQNGWEEPDEDTLELIVTACRMKYEEEVMN
jgi:hypothetical protein